MKPRGIWELSTPRLRDLHIALGRAGQALFTETQLQGAGFDDPAVAMLMGMPAHHADALVAAVLAERTVNRESSPAARPGVVRSRGGADPVA